MTYTFKPGTYQTRDGRKAVVLCNDAPSMAPLVGYVIQPDGDDCSSRSWTREGRISYREQGLDLLPPVEEKQDVVRWAIMDRTGKIDLSPYPCAGAHHYAPSGNYAKACTRVVLTPGRFDTEDSPSEYDRGWNEALDAAADAVVESVNQKHPSAVVRALRRPS